MNYPLTFPTNPRLTPRNIEFASKVQASTFQSPWTGQTQVYKYQGSWWELNLTFPVLKQSDAEELTGFLTGLYGQVGSFYFTLPAKFQSTGTITLTMAANGTDFTGASATPAVGKFGVDNNRRLVQFVTTSSLFPNLKSGSNSIIGNKGASYRLATNETRWSVNQFMYSEITIPIVETM